MKEKTLILIKPDATSRGISGLIIDRFCQEKFEICAIKAVNMTVEVAKLFYLVHKAKPFYDELTEYMSSGKTIAIVFERENAISYAREIMGNTNPLHAAAGTIRKEFGESLQRNSVHGSDSLKSAAYEIPFFFSTLEVEYW